MRDARMRQRGREREGGRKEGEDEEGQAGKKRPSGHDKRDYNDKSTKISKQIYTDIPVRACIHTHTYICIHTSVCVWGGCVWV